MSWFNDKVVTYPCTYDRLSQNKELYTHKENIVPGTREHDAQCLFDMMVDYCIETNFKNEDGSYVINPDMKSNFSLFIKRMSK